ncbi:MAG: DUF2240 family protein [Archaeoglobales archaeon]|nr:DUF2240 family protein [Archaeoglobales archaeon]
MDLGSFGEEFENYVDKKDPSKNEKNSVKNGNLLDIILKRISEKTGKSFQEIISEINAKQEKMGNLLSFEIVAVIFAKESGVKISDLLDEIEKRLLS